MKPLAAAVSSGDVAAVQDLREEVMQQLAVVSGPKATGEDGEVLEEDLDIPGLVEASDEMTLQDQVGRLAQARTEDSVRTIRGWMAS